ncbi:UDP-N-acetyl-D-mannosaminuronic acid transferase [Vibrio chagasii]|nr:UDP-N-acetyl-D-mannosaminuronic acid transferase [Vibrio chagasii]CAH7053748.1 UDP-N-acetyl-D-mannosaminuronic acid transferase [Vibrio chagasii]CAH7065118.1 UDP-N-acetyl-D-mannosaminuronic acid transferase [Vibrio chagasii]CAH7362574.1 UDP-N-acetyl-D-mannosaminuronic acid transferase [Vibrio chagasii]CAH7377426.1 UDP-N-acetyl-D-mannosaminuronic acid transferase [Vibrio chagasii]
MIDKVNINNLEINCYTSVDDASNYIIENNLDDANIAIAINPEKILSSLENKAILSTLEAADIRYLDGIGTVKVAEKRIGKKLSRIPGCELWESLMSKAGKSNIPVYILGANKTVVSKTVTKLKNDYSVNIVGYHDGFFENDDDLIKSILSTKPRILTVALGSPRQEVFMKRCKELGADFFMMGVGGTYNVYTGEVKRAPKIWCNLNLEWLYRLLKEPSRIKRQIKLLNFIKLYFLNKI